MERCQSGKQEGEDGQVARQRKMVNHPVSALRIQLVLPSLFWFVGVLWLHCSRPMRERIGRADLGSLLRWSAIV